MHFLLLPIIQHRKFLCILIGTPLVTTGLNVAPYDFGPLFFTLTLPMYILTLIIICTKLSMCYSSTSQSCVYYNCLSLDIAFLGRVAIP